MRVDPLTDSRPLLTRFFSACENAFRFLERERGHSYCAGLATYVGGRQIIRPYHHESVSPPFFAVMRYERGATSIEILYDGEGQSVNAYFCPDRIHRFSMNELLRAARKTPVREEKIRDLDDPSRLEDAVFEIAAILSANVDALIDIDEALVEKTAIGRAREMEKKVRDQFHDHLTRNVDHAREAFATDNFKVVIALLTPYERYLQKDDLEKLRIARESLLT